jgi:hypothetical protein
LSELAITRDVDTVVGHAAGGEISSVVGKRPAATSEGVAGVMGGEKGRLDERIEESKKERKGG